MAIHQLQTETTLLRLTNLPDVEDINMDNTLTTDEKYFQYRVDLTPGKMKEGQNFIVDDYLANNITLRNGATTSVHWYQFKIPVKQFQKVVGNIQDLHPSASCGYSSQVFANRSLYVLPPCSSSALNGVNMITTSFHPVNTYLQLPLTTLTSPFPQLTFKKTVTLTFTLRHTSRHTKGNQLGHI